MVRINLLPVRSNKKQETAKLQIIIFAVVIISSIVICGIVYSFTLIKIKTTKQEITNTEQQIAALKVKIGEIDNIKKLQDEVRRKLDVLNQLRKNKTGPANLLAHVSDSVPERVWLTKYVENGSTVSLAGVAYNEELIAEFMRKLLAAGVLSSVELQVSEQFELSGVKAKRFELLCSINTSLPPPAKDGGLPKK